MTRAALRSTSSAVQNNGWGRTLVPVAVNYPIIRKYLAVAVTGFSWLDGSCLHLQWRQFTPSPHPRVHVYGECMNAADGYNMAVQQRVEGWRGGWMLDLGLRIAIWAR